MSSTIPQQGWTQQTPAVKAILGGQTRASTPRRRRKKSNKASAAKRVTRTARKVHRTARKLKKGSAAAKAFMARLRKMRKR